MIVKCKTSKLSDLPKDLQDFAFTQDNDGVLDITVGKEYRVYGIQKNDLGKFYLVLTDSIHFQLPWWMPASLYEVLDSRTPDTWKKETVIGNYGENEVIAPSAYFGHEEDIEDGESAGYEAFEAMSRDG